MQIRSLRSVLSLALVVAGPAAAAHAGVYNVSYSYSDANRSISLTGTINVTNNVATSGSLSLAQSGIDGFGSRLNFNGATLALVNTYTDGQVHASGVWGTSYDNVFNPSNSFPLTSYGLYFKSTTTDTSLGLPYYFNGFLRNDGTGHIALYIDNGDPELLTGAATFTPAPAPGAIALMGVAGAMGRHRRR